MELMKNISSRQVRKFSLTNQNLFAKMKLKNLKGKSKSSQDWLIRQHMDPYVEKAKFMNYRCRSAFKLIEIDDKYKILKPGSVVVDCGASPGSWSQIAAQRTNADKNLGTNQSYGQVYAIDLLQIHPIRGVTLLGGMDFTATTTQEKLKTLIGGNRRVNCVISDMAPNATGIKHLDNENIINLCYSVLKFSILMSAEGSNLLLKIWDNGLVPKLENDIERFYENVRRIKPKSSRNDSSECFILARNFKGIEEIS